MKFGTTLSLLAIFAALGGYVLWSGKSGAGGGSAATATPEIAVLQLNPGDVSAVVVREAGGKQARVERSGSSWNVAAPKASPGDTTGISGVVDALAKLTATQTITPASQDLAPYGLSRPRIVQLLKGNTTLAELRIGDKNPNGSATYVQRSGSPAIYLVTAPELDSATQWLTAPPLQPTPLPTPPPPAQTSPVATATSGSVR